MFRGPVARAGFSTLPRFHSCPSPSCICVSPPLSIARNSTLVHAASSACAQLTIGLALGCLGSESSRWLYNYFPPRSSRLHPSGKKISRCTRVTTPWQDGPRQIEKFITRQPPKGEKDDYDSENSWISDGLPSSSNSSVQFNSHLF